MTRRLAPLLAVALLAAACGSAPRPAPRAQAAGAGAAGAAAAPAAAASSSAPEWSYTSVGKRDPFRSFLGETEGAGAALNERCTTPLGRFELDQVKLVAVVTGLDDPRAMVEGPNGVGYELHRGACVGKNGGVVAAVRSGEVVVSEWAIRADGTRDRTQTVLKLPKQASPVLEE